MSKQPYRSNHQYGDIIGVLKFSRRAESEPGRPAAYFICECGKEFFSRIDSVKNLRTKSCGCKTSQFIIDAQTKYIKEFAISETGKKVKLIPIIGESDIARFWNKVKITADVKKCWNWSATGERYGHFSLGNCGDYKSNRIAYFLCHNVDPRFMSVLHSCDNPKCCNPNHLSLGTHYDNMRDMARKGRCKSGWDNRRKKTIQNEN